eukprot:Sspe_Gene.82200::Locus_53867_Transcript_1_1_Confidence_1.000_Length_1234::g.82200::m.82200/K03841/FBP, fbp; fructose-1,6-bisphosphatase I
MAVENIVEHIQRAVKEVAGLMAKGHLEESFGKKHGKANESGDIQETVDVAADHAMSRALSKCADVSCYASEELDLVNFTEHPKGKYMVVYDPLDGSQNIPVNITTGLIFGIFECSVPWSPPKNGRSMVAAGYAIFGAATQIILARKGKGITVYNLNPETGDFVVTKERHVIPTKGKVYACNEGLQPTWVTERSRKWAEAMRGRSVRWMACMVSDVHRVLMEGGGFLLPADKKNVNGKLRLVYEAYPMAFIFEEAGGVGLLEDLTPILDVPFPNYNDSKALHRKIPVFLASPHEASIFTAKL